MERPTTRFYCASQKPAELPDSSLHKAPFARAALVARLGPGWRQVLFTLILDRQVSDIARARNGCQNSEL